jgi:Putative prokaryotic signal transducing protein
VKKVFTARDVAEAHFVRDVLESHGLTVTLCGESLWGTRGEVPFADAWPTVWVLDDRREAEAREVVQQYEAGLATPPADARTWRCPRCGQELEAQFTTCWSCGTERSS